MKTSFTQVAMTLSSSSKKTAHIELTTRCRLSCPKCDRTLDKNLKIVDISLEAIIKYATSDFEKFILCGSYGDPIYHPKFIEIIKILKQHKKIIHIHTNGSGKTSSFWESLYCLLDDQDVVWFSMDGLEDTCGLYRVNFTTNDYKNNLEWMKLSTKYKVNVIWIFIAFNFNEHQIEHAKQLAKSMGIIFCLRKSARWINNSDPLKPKNPFLYVKRVE